MPFRRRSVQTAKTVRTLQAAIERLESRQLLTAVVNGIFQDTGTNEFSYRQGDQTNVQQIRISVTGNITAEFIGGIPGGVGGATLTDLVTSGTQFNDDPRNVYLFSIYVVKADMNSAISISRFSTTDGHMIPFEGQGVTIAQVGTLPNGGAYLGTKTGAPSNTPTITTAQRRFGMRPSSAGEMYAGLEVAPGQSLGKFYFGGTISGVVDIPGNMDEFVAGNLLTGSITNVGSTGVIDFVSNPQLLQNFHVGGDIRNIMIKGEIGSGAFPGTGNLSGFGFKSDTRIDVAGRLGSLYSATDMAINLNVRNDSRVRGPGSAVREYEYIAPNLTGGSSYFDPSLFGYDMSPQERGPDPDFVNNSFDTAQFLGSIRSHSMKDAIAIDVKGSLGNGANDPIDFYGVGLLAGQTIDVTLLDDITTTSPHVGIFDPEGRLVASNYVKIPFVANLPDRGNSTFRFTAPRAGTYRFAVAGQGDTTFTGTAGSTGLPYELRITGAGDIGLGGVVARAHIATTDTGFNSISVLRGDFGGMQADGQIFSTANPYRVPRGSIRAIEGGSLGIATTVIVIGSGPDFAVKGSIGLLRNTDAAAMLSVDDDSGIYPTSSSSFSNVSPTLAVGKDIQLVDAAGSIEGALLANGSIGVIRGDSIGGLIGGPAFMADVDATGDDGIIDLIDVTTNLNGAAISTGPNGNVRYMHVAAGATVTRDPFFGGGTPEEILYAPGTKAHLTDDSGAHITLTGTPLEGQPAGSTSSNPLFDPPQLEVLTYPIRGKSGVVILRVTVTPLDDTTDGIVATGGAGLTVDSDSVRGSVEIGEAVISGTANTFTFDIINRVYTQTAIPAPPTLPIRDVNVILRGDTPVSIWNIDGTGATITNIENQTAGEIVNVSGTPDVFNIEGETVGLAESHTGTAVEGVTVRNNTYPFVNQKNLVEVGDVATIRARRGLGNILAANVGNVVANSDNENVRGVFEGINAPIVSTTGDTAAETGNIVSVNIGEGIAFAGNGGVGVSGLYARGIIDHVVGTTASADIRGNIVATNSTTFTQVQAVDPVSGAGLTNPDGTPLLLDSPTYGIGDIKLNGGSIVEANIQLTAFDEALIGNGGFLFLESADTFTDTIYDIGEVTLKGGGIIGSFFGASDIGRISIKDGYGIFTSAFVEGGEGVFDGIVTDGFGVRDSFLAGGARVNSVIANGNGRLVASNSYSASVRQSERGAFDPATGELLDRYNDLHKNLGTRRTRQKSSTESGTGIIQDVQMVGGRDLGKIEAQRIRAARVYLADPVTGARTRVAYDDPIYPMRISFANSIGSIAIRDNIDGLSLSSGDVNTLAAGKDFIRSSINISGSLKTLSAGQFRSSAAFNITGPEGTVESISTRHNLFSTINASQGIGAISVGGDIGARRIQIGGNLDELTVNGSVLTGTTIRVGRILDELFIGRDLKANATIRAKAINEQTVNGQIIGDIIIA
jgi:hypothetical protein